MSTVGAAHDRSETVGFPNETPGVEGKPFDTAAATAGELIAPMPGGPLLVMEDQPPVAPPPQEPVTPLDPLAGDRAPSLILGLASGESVMEPDRVGT